MTEDQAFQKIIREIVKEHGDTDAETMTICRRIFDAGVYLSQSKLNVERKYSSTLLDALQKIEDEPNHLLRADEVESDYDVQAWKIAHEAVLIPYPERDL